MHHEPGAAGRLGNALHLARDGRDVHSVVIHELEPFDARGATVVAAFPSVGLVATIAANFIIDSLELPQVGILDGERFPTLSVVSDGEPSHPVRIHAGKVANQNGDEQKFVVFIAEFRPPADLVRSVAEAILSWCREHDVGLLVTPEGLLVDGEGAEDNILEVYTIGSTEASRNRLTDAGAPLFRDGVVAGVTGVLLNGGRRDAVDVVGILAEAKPEHPDARSAAAVIEIIAQLTGAKLPASDLYREADRFEGRMMRFLRSQEAADTMTEGGRGGDAMFG